MVPDFDEECFPYTVHSDDVTSQVSVRPPIDVIIAGFSALMPLNMLKKGAFPLSRIFQDLAPCSPTHSAEARM